MGTGAGRGIRTDTGASMGLWRAVGRLLAVAALLVLGLAPATRVAAQDDEETYESPQYGYTLTYDTDEWEVAGEDPDEDDAYDRFYLGNGVSSIVLIGDPDYDEDEIDTCLDDYVTGFEGSDAVSDVEEYDDQDAEGEEEDRIWATYTFTFEFDDGDESDFARYLECQALGDGLTVVIIHDAPVDDYEDEVSEREDLLEGLEGPSDADEDDEDATQTAEPEDEDEQDDPDQDQNDVDDDAEIADGEWEGETEDGEDFTLTILDGGVSSVSYAYECNGEPIIASAAVSDPAPIEDGEFELETETSNQTTTVVGTFADGEAEGTLTHETDDEDECSVELDWTAEEP